MCWAMACWVFNAPRSCVRRAYSLVVRERLPQCSALLGKMKKRYVASPKTYNQTDFDSANRRFDLFCPREGWGNSRRGFNSVSCGRLKKVSQLRQAWGKV